MRYRKVYTPTDYTTITPGMVRRWMAMEARLDELHNRVLEEPEKTFDADFVIQMLEYIKIGENYYMEDGTNAE